jgi:DNA-binding IclR family transcriptional regulator
MTMMADDRDVRVRIHAEYEEMPGLKLTLAQASRLFNLERARCERALDALVSGGVLRTDGRTFLHARAGRHYV